MADPPYKRRGEPPPGPASEIATAKQLNLVVEDTSAVAESPRTEPDPAARRRNLEEGRRRADEGADAARTNTPIGARHEAEAALESLIATGAPFDVEDLRERLGGHVLGAHDNAIGAVVRNAARQGRIVAVGVRKATRVRARGHLIRVWRSRS